MTTCKELKKLSNARIKVAKMLLRSGDYNGAIDNIGFGLELALKAAICTKLKIETYPDQMSGSLNNKSEQSIVNFFRTHDFAILAMLSGISSDLALQPQNSRRLNQNWSDLTTMWTPDIRYSPIGTFNQADALRCLEAAMEKPDGVISWIRRRW